ncbi:hypothetical protein UFOVP715_7 [uncultured Caudovirales phage]|jgi:TRAP-type C4-dicarboxylate transport system permease small subunit|uniref:Uncharacterized protein n=1 Tax=uncultured Caudovirales phage TaxID=2100421 RepID=A0A6J5NR48_9CAUD|nr:hypothetical protein UFOVP715_7 [uncultured Caudovirales phage]
MKDWAVSFIAAALLIGMVLWCTREIVALLRGF